MIIETERLLLRQFCEGDAEDLYEYLESPEVNCFESMKLNSPEAAKEALGERTAEPELYLAIELKGNGKAIGEIAAFPERDEHLGTELPPDTFSPIWMLNPGFKGRGHAFEAARAFFDYLFCEKGARRIYAYTEEDNLPSRRLCEKLGMRHEGTFIEFISFVNNADGTPKYENTCQYAILKKEWRL